MEILRDVNQKVKGARIKDTTSCSSHQHDWRIWGRYKQGLITFESTLTHTSFVTFCCGHKFKVHYT